MFRCEGTKISRACRQGMLDSVSLWSSAEASAAERAFSPPQSRPDGQSAPNGQSTAQLVWHCPRSVGWAMRRKGAQPSARLGSPTAGLEQIGFEPQERQRVITRCALNVRSQESATVIRSGSVVLTMTALPQRLVPGRSRGSLGKARVLPNKPRQTGGSSSVGRASAFQAECRGFETRLPLQFPFRSRPVRTGGVGLA